MGATLYNFETRSVRSSSSDYKSVITNDAVFKTVFKQQEERKAHESMRSHLITLRESRFSEAHPFVYPVILALDVTGSMSDIPKHLIAEDLPKLMSKLIQKGLDISLLFMCVGDHECDRYPLQIGQFESGDLELDTWLTRSYLEGAGGGNSGESYMLPWYFASNFVQTDMWDKHKIKPLIITLGDEPVLTNLPKNAIKEIFNIDVQSGLKTEDILATTLEKFECEHVHVNHGYRRPDENFNIMMGQRFQIVEGKDNIIDKVVEVIENYYPVDGVNANFTPNEKVNIVEVNSDIEEWM